MHLGDEDITIYMKTPKLEALREVLAQNGLEVENLLNDYLDELYEMSVAPNVIADIDAMLTAADEAERLEKIANRRFTAVQVTQDGVTRYAEAEQGSYDNPDCRRLSITGADLRNYLRNENCDQAFFERYNSATEITKSEFEAHCSSIGDPNNPHCTFALCFDFDSQIAGETDGSGWKYWSMKDISSAAYYSHKAGRMPKDRIDAKFYGRLEGKEIQLDQQPGTMEMT